MIRIASTCLTRTQNNYGRGLFGALWLNDNATFDRPERPINFKPMKLEEALQELHDIVDRASRDSGLDINIVPVKDSIDAGFESALIWAIEEMGRHPSAHEACISILSQAQGYMDKKITKRNHSKK